MKKISLLLVALTTLSFSSSYSMDGSNPRNNNNTDNTGFYIVAGLVLVGGYYYYNNYYNTPSNNTNKPSANTNNSNKITLLTIAAGSPEAADKFLQKKQNEQQTPASKSTKYTKVDAPKPSVVTPPTQDKNTTQSVPTKTTDKPTIVPVVTTSSTTEIKSGFLDNLRISMKKMDPERLLRENMDILEG